MNRPSWQPPFSFSHVTMFQLIDGNLWICIHEEGTRDFFAFKTTDNVTNRLLAGDRIIELERPVDSALSDLVLDHTHMGNSLRSVILT